MNPEAIGPAIYYYMVRGGSDKTNITVWESGTVGGEYIKTYGHYHIGDLCEKTLILQGEGIFISQTRALDITGKPQDDIIESFRAVQVKAGDLVEIPAEAGHLFVNTGPIWLVTSDDSPVNFAEKNAVDLPGHADYEPFKKLHGAAYYIIEQNGQPTLMKNPNYQQVPEAHIE